MDMLINKAKVKDGKYNRRANILDAVKELNIGLSRAEEFYPSVIDQVRDVISTQLDWISPELKDTLVEAFERYQSREFVLLALLGLVSKLRKLQIRIEGLEPYLFARYFATCIAQIRSQNARVFENLRQLTIEFPRFWSQHRSKKVEVNPAVVLNTISSISLLPALEELTLAGYIGIYAKDRNKHSHYFRKPGAEAIGTLREIWVDEDKYREYDWAQFEMRRERGIWVDVDEYREYSEIHRELALFKFPLNALCTKHASTIQRFVIPVRLLSHPFEVCPYLHPSGRVSMLEMLPESLEVLEIDCEAEFSLNIPPN
ncbi:hypothetical protein BDY21DRAFT_411971 [Lineolata rhizophorae]|uniref:Uncharacterized protein n=1 Tax=Lineolata rhizophorae TaxID=578093 RepID=A0A6A6P2X2_9PEZI|nr:hypothetical protein BDY21DRAFT_411971 [Lineolata rhizophorae]